MKTHSLKDDTLHFAMHNALECANIFNRLASIARNLKIKKIFDDIALAEYAHMASLSRLHDDGILTEEMFMGVKVNSYLNGYHPDHNLEYVEVLEAAMRKVRLALDLYLEMGSKSVDKEVRELFKSMAVKENTHKLIVETEYNDSILIC